MKITTVLFDLDGTLLPMDQDEFTSGYFKFLIEKMRPYGYEPKELINSVWAGVSAMVRNDGKISNHDAFWQKLNEIYGEKAVKDKPVFEEFYRNEFKNARIFCGYNPKAAETVRRLKEIGYRVALATNPIFPLTATEIRIGWAGLSLDDFEISTYYENSNYCKPNPDYYKTVAQRLRVSPNECLMVGNDADEDTSAELIGMDVFLLTDCLKNSSGKDISSYNQGDFDALAKYLDKDRL